MKLRARNDAKSGASLTKVGHTMVKTRTTTDYIKTNLEIYGSHLNRYLDELRDGGKSESAIRSIRSKIRSFLMRCPPTSPDGLTANIMMKVKKKWNRITSAKHPSEAR